MAATDIVIPLVLGTGMFVSAGLSVLSFRHSKSKMQAETSLTEAEKQKLLEDINKSRTEERILQERWWAEQLGLVRGSFEAEQLETQRLREENAILWREFDRVVAFIRIEHKRWDDKAAARIRELSGEDFEDPPQLELNGRRKDDRRKKDD